MTHPKDNNIPIRIAVNPGSLAKDLLKKYVEPNSDALVESEEILSEAEELKSVLEINFDEDINKLHDKVNNFFIQDKLDSIQLDVNVDLLEPDA